MPRRRLGSAKGRFGQQEEKGTSLEVTALRDEGSGSRLAPADL